MTQQIPVYVATNYLILNLSESYIIFNITTQPLSCSLHFSISLKAWHLELESPASSSLTVRAAASEHISPPSSAMQRRWHQIYCLKSSFTLMLQLPGWRKAVALPLSADSKKLPVSLRWLTTTCSVFLTKSEGQVEQKRVDFILGNSVTYQPTICSAEITMYPPRPVCVFLSQWLFSG